MATLSGFNFKVMHVIYFFMFMIILRDLVIYHPTCIHVQMTNCLTQTLHAMTDNFTLFSSIFFLVCLSYCTTNRKVAGSIPDGVIGIFH
jgi:hypothetical protein